MPAPTIDDGSETIGREDFLATDRLDMPSPSEAEDIFADRSLSADVEALFEDGKTYLEAEFGFQKSRLAYVADRAKWAGVYGIAAIVVALAGFIGLAVGLIIALAPYITAWGATALVAGGLLIAAWLLARRALGTVSDIQDAFDDRKDGA